MLTHTNSHINQNVKAKINILEIVFVSLTISILSIYAINIVHADTLINTIPDGESPAKIAFNPINNNIYVTNNIVEGTVSVIDVTTNTVVDTIPVGEAPIGIAFNPFNNNLYVANLGSATVSVIDGSTNAVITTIPIGTPIAGFVPHAIAFNPFNNNIYVTSSAPFPNSVLVIDSLTNTVVDTIAVGDDPRSLAFNPINNNMYVTNANSDTVSVIDSSTNTVVDTIPVDDAPFAIAFNQFNNNMYVTNFNSGTVSVIDSLTNTVVDTIPVGNLPLGIEFNPISKNIYVTNGGSNTVSVIDSSTNTVIDTIDVGIRPFGITFNPSNNLLYVANFDSDNISVIQSITEENNPFRLNFKTAIDGNGQPVQNVTGETTSTSLTLTFAISGNENDIPNFECKIDNVVVVDCLNLDLNQDIATISLNDLEPGNHIFTINNFYFIWTIIPQNQQHICDDAFPNIDKLWPPNHDIRTISILGINNNDDYSISITKVLQDEPTAINPGDNSPDASVTNNDLVQLRAERDGNGDGRVYHIQFTVSDNQDRDICNGEVLVSVPHDQNKDAIDSGARFDSTQQ